MRRWRHIGMAALLWTSSMAAAWAAVSRPMVFSRVLSAEVQGLVFYADGRTPAINVPVRIWDTQTRKFIYHTVTDERGFFALPKLSPGTYYLTFDWLKVELKVVERSGPLAQQPHDVIVVIPRGMGLVSFNQLSLILLAGTLAEQAAIYIPREPRRPPIVSP